MLHNDKNCQSLEFLFHALHYRKNILSSRRIRTTWCMARLSIFVI